MKPREGTRRDRKFPIGWAGVTLLALSLALCACTERAREAARLLSDIASGGDPSRLKAETPTPERREVVFQGGTGDLYVSPAGPLAALVLVPGLAPAGKDDPRLVAFAHSLARARFAVLVPDISSLRAIKVRPGDVDAIADAARWLSARAPLHRGRSIGLVAISYAAGPALLAATIRDVGPQVGFVMAVGGYHDIDKMVTFFTTGAFRIDGKWRYAEPNAIGSWIFVKSNAERVGDPDDRLLLTEIAEARLNDPMANIDAASSRLGPEGRSLLALVRNRDRARVGALIRALPAAIRDDMAALDPSAAALDELTARLILIHGRDDTIIPYSESVDLARRLGRSRASLYLLDGLWHVDADFSLADRWTLWEAAIELLELRDGEGRGAPKAGEQPMAREP